jgi:hypothetical protein
LSYEPYPILKLAFRTIPLDELADCWNSTIRAACTRLIASDIVNGKKTYRIQKQYLERPKELIVDTRTNSILLILANMKDSAFFQYKFVPWEEYTGDNISWENGALSQNVIEIKDLPIGTYLLYIRDSISGKESQGYKITVSSSLVSNRTI